MLDRATVLKCREFALDLHDKQYSALEEKYNKDIAEAAYNISDEAAWDLWMNSQVMGDLTGMKSFL